MSQKLVLIDGHSILNRAFYGVPDLSNAEGLHTNAIYGFLNIMFKILEEESRNIWQWLLMFMHRLSATKCMRLTRERESLCRRNCGSRCPS